MCLTYDREATLEHEDVSRMWKLFRHGLDYNGRLIPMVAPMAGPLPNQWNTAELARNPDDRASDEKALNAALARVKRRYVIWSGAWHGYLRRVDAEAEATRGTFAVECECRGLIAVNVARREIAVREIKPIWPEVKEGE